VWAFGVILFNMATGKMPFNTEPYSAVARDTEKQLTPISHQIVNKPITSKYLKQKLQMSDQLADLISKLLQKDARSRLSMSACLKHDWFK